MITYKGVSADEIADSIIKAKQLVYSLTSDPEIISHIERLTDEDIKDVRTAETQAELAHTIRSKLIGVFIFANEFFKTHGALDTNNTARGVAYDLMRWEAMAGARSLVMTQTDIAIEKHLQAFPQPTEEQLIEFYKNAPPAFMQRFGIEHDLKDGDGFSDDIGKFFEENILPHVKDFQQKDEFGMYGYGIIGDIYAAEKDKRKVGFMFECSVECAQHLAKTLPDYKIISSKDEVVKAKTNTALKKRDKKSPHKKFSL